MPLPWIALGATALGSVLNARSQGKQRSQQQNQFNEVQALLQQFMGQGATGAEGMIQGMMNQSRGGQNLEWLNTATDPIMQSLRRGPNQAFMEGNLQGIAETGNPFDMTQIIESLNPLRQREADQGLAELRAAAPGLGSRFGTATKRAEADFLAQTGAQNNALDAQIMMEGHESAQARRLQALAQLLGVDQLQAQRDQTGLSSLMEMGRLGLADQGMQNQLAQLLLQGQLQRRGQNLQGIAGLAGLSMPQGDSPWGGASMDMGQMLMMMELFKDG